MFTIVDRRAAGLWRTLSLAVAAMIATLAAASAQTPPLDAGPVVAPGATLERVFDGGFWTEGPAVGPDGRIYFCDITMTFATGMEAGNIWVFDPATGKATVFRSPSGMAAGIKFDREGRMVVTQGADFGGRAVVRTDLKTGRSTILAGLYKGRPFNAPNDLDIDSQGRIYFTDPRYFGHEPIEQPVFGVYRIDTDGAVHLILADVARPNGIALSPDEKTLYVAEHDFLLSDRRIDKVPQRNGFMRLLAYDLAADGTASNQRVIADYGKEAGPDGLAVDASGNVYAAVQAASRRGVHVYSSKGEEIAYIPVPNEPAITNVALATRDGRTDLYITAKKSLYRIHTLIPGRPR
ncbi:SMP-30/gluconolactonase/LRE family protein [Bradyrhizobium sp. U87765 SZCCT0131]|uniref:SMP-30/gluconolactonase/LRE family protein n=1 Tax=unclassified Bradyrhizobium TaxID=2631580 RepID=UPI001BAABF9B|nr:MULTISPECIES: SMP-30/gluconolactonase/LRE family protein [unclassified Bradyrhizobium]MBR1218845.1 SMP-30/gluconolactonase/LRE family protein [Bradyrhizobium sp. U87765 SZCCT0131]MBR1261496.1 SMP-30/gluconolactonase/LRE family protein [Bradyrhizobium sp. U87765 SZCCT0134]MBR1306651.1 SMP-30/gluconolactonase/LRE family protein [Bradyrhizobium sp. U87765 SZCCT0110]MBR1317278.1 SMP-30/gluconolactonase/LRE family protein [Bradyrhizobium sp. U87765 SZCCT0109]MBR1350980.1 SMP-30/gluconolactonase/